MSKLKLRLEIEYVDDSKMDLDDDYVIMLRREWNVIEDWLKLCKRAGVLEKQYEPILDTTIWPLSMKSHSAYDA